MTMKVVFEKATYRLLGAQIVGYEGVDKRIDVLATAIRAGMKATELKDLDLAYAPPYSSAKDPVNMAGFMVENIANGVLKQWHLEDADRLPRDGSVTLLDTALWKNSHTDTLTASLTSRWTSCGSGWVSWTSVSLSTSSVRAVCAATLPVVSWPETALTAITSPAASGSMML